MTFKSSLLAASALALAIGGLMALPASAHRQWLLTSTNYVDGKDRYVTVDAAVSEGLFDFDHLPIKLDNVVVTGPDGGTVTPENVGNGKFRTTFDLNLAKDGTYRIANVSTAIMGRYTLNGEQKRFRATEADLASQIPAGATDVAMTRTYGRVETFVTSGHASDGVLEPTGQGLELVPLSHPSELVADEPAKFRVLLDGQPLAGLNLTVVPGGGKYRSNLKDFSVTSDANGDVTIAWPMAQTYWIGASYPARVQQPEGTPPDPNAPMPEKRWSYTGVFQVMPF
ncbi:nickel uptake substrate-specific transmembrane region family protein [Asticcacaulis biprosthecium C19]|uniref:Nickel uptake substrate-specific transmembrane region family protein n=1 Tax=Asticcacaulis biprosthecium C19 TaxID=715226 RepID=F4QN52_9CAUL|nr:DUF4198 domain-containing protein [Asticcacaulis biprosthecium]EGF91643.1 nickel uptake substrate-specific transmembrane region family protein [Asticcacaulis biprosthecium C19]